MHMLSLPLSLLLLSTTARAELVVVASQESPISQLSRAQLAEVFSGRTRIVNGHAITPVEYANADRERFYQQVLGRSPSQMRTIWAKLLFTGDGQPPRVFANYAEARSQLLADRGLITYIDSKQLGPGLKVIFP